MRIDIQKFNKVARVLDWVLAFVSLGVGIWMQSAWIIAAAIFGLAVAWYNPAPRLQRFLIARIVKRTRPA